MTLQSLLSRIETATGPDRMIDADLFFEFEPDFPSGAKQMVGFSDPAPFATGAYTSVKAPEYTASVDDALALVERVLPGWWPHAMGRSPLHGLWWCTLYSLDKQQEVEVEDLNSLPLAILSALITAKLNEADQS